MEITKPSCTKFHNLFIWWYIENDKKARVFHKAQSIKKPM